MELIAAALPLWERLAADPGEGRHVDGQEAAVRLRVTWSGALGDATGARLRERLADSGWAVSPAMAALAAPATAHTEPGWASLLDELPDACEHAALDGWVTGASARTHPIPFEELLEPLVLIARKRLARELASSPGVSPSPCLTDRAYLTLERTLLKQLANVGGAALYREFDANLDTARRAALKLFGGIEGESPREHYLAFVRRHLSSSYSELFREYPVLLRLFGLCLEFWVGASAEFLRRLADDWPELAVNPATSLTTGISDAHNGHRYVVIVERDPGWRLVYKPKDLVIEAAFSSFLDWCNSQQDEIHLKVLDVWPRAGYGWVEFAQQLPCADPEAACRYYRRAGALLAVLDLLRATDCHRENLIAHGEHPVLIDLETLFYSAPRRNVASQSVALAHADLDDFLATVIGTGMLPRWDLDPVGGNSFDVSALACLDGLRTPRKAPQVLSANTDDMLLAYAHLTEPEQANVPRCTGGTVYPDDHADDVCRGFEGVYRLFMDKRALLGQDDGPLAAFRNVHIRAIVRNTREYQYLLAASYQPEPLRNGVERSLILERLAAGAEHYCAGCGYQLAQAEIDALERMDIPYFASRTDSLDLFACEEKLVGGFFARTGFQNVQERLARLDESDLYQQQAIIRGTFLAARRAPPPSPWSEMVAQGHESHLTPADMVAEAVRLGDEILARAARHADGRLSWRALAYFAEAGRYQMQPLGESLYEGKPGVAVFLAGLAAVTGQSRFADGARRALVTGQNYWRDPQLASQVALRNAMGIGGILGAGSLGYALLTVANLIGDDGLRQAGLGTLALLSREVIAADGRHDLMDGWAGALMCLLRGHAESSEMRYLDAAVACGDHLLRARVEVGRGGLAWRSHPSQPALTGFSHGASGIALALARLAQATGDNRYLDGVDSALRFERAWFSPAQGNWQDLRRSAAANSDSTEAPAFMNAWCNGAAGIGLSRWELAGMLGRDDLVPEVGAAVKAVLSQNTNDLDHLCCGNFGRYELLLQANAKDVELRPQLARRLSELVHGAAARGGYRLHYGLPADTWHPGFFRGTSGIGYSLLRHAGLTSLPNVLTLE